MRGARAAVALALLSLVVAVGSPAAPTRGTPVYTGPAFDTCSAPSLQTMQAWLASPYRAIGIYVGGVNRACPDGNLSAAWTSTVVASGWNLLPLYVGPQAPCVTRAGLALINPSTAAGDGAAAADDAVARAGGFGISTGAPVYFDMEGYKTGNAGCTKAVQTFVAGWVSRLHARGFLAGVYGSAASTIRDLVPLEGTSASPDAVWIADWNGKTSVFGDPYISDEHWPAHQRLHQYRGGHHESYGGITVNIDSDSVDAPVVGSGGVVGLPPPPSPPQGGSVTTSDGETTVAWPSTALPAGSSVTATPTALPAETNGFAAGSYVVQIAAVTPTGAPVTSFAARVAVVFHTPGTGVVPAYSSDGASWQPLRGTLAADGSLNVSVSAPGEVGLLRDLAPPSRPSSLAGRLRRGRLLLAWAPSTDNSGAVASYEIDVDGHPLASASGVVSHTAVRGFSSTGPTVFRIAAIDTAGNRSSLSRAVVIKPRGRPSSAPHAIPDWAFQLAAWQQAGRAGKRPAAPKPVPSWYWRWQAWRLQPFRVAG